MSPIITINSHSTTTNKSMSNNKALVTSMSSESKSTNFGVTNLLYTMEQMELIRRLKKTGISAAAIIEAFRELEQVETDLQHLHQKEQKQQNNVTLTTAKLLLNNNNNNFNKSSRSLDGGVLPSSRKNSLNTKRNDLAHQRRRFSGAATVLSNDSTLLFNAAPLVTDFALALNTNTTPSLSAAMEVLQNGLNQKNCNSNTAFLFQQLQQKLWNEANNGNNEEISNQLNGSLTYSDTVKVLKNLFLSTQKHNEQQYNDKNVLNQRNSPSSTSPPPEKNGRFSSTEWSSPASPLPLTIKCLSQINNDVTLNTNCSSSASIMSVLNHAISNKASSLTSFLSTAKSGTLNDEKLNHQNNTKLLTVLSCASPPLKLRNDEENDDCDVDETHPQNLRRRHSAMLPASANAAFDSDLMTLNHYHQQRAQLQNIARQQNIGTNNYGNSKMSLYKNQESSAFNRQQNFTPSLLLPSTIGVTNTTDGANALFNTLGLPCSSTTQNIQASISPPPSSTSSSASATNAAANSSITFDQNAIIFGFGSNQNASGCRPIRSQRTPMKDITTLDNPAELDEFMQRGEESCINDMKQFITQFSLRQTTVAMMTGVSQPYISKLLNGNHRELSMRCRKNIYSWYLNCRRHPAKLALFTQDPSSRLETNGDGELIPQRRERYVFRPLLIKILEAYFAQSQFPDNSKRMEIAQACNEALKMNKKGTQLMPKEVVTPQVIANWFANKRKENRRKSHDETDSLDASIFSGGSLSLSLQPPSSFSLQSTSLLSSSNQHMALPTSAPSALAFQLTNAATVATTAAGTSLDSLYQTSFQHQNFFDNIIASSSFLANATTATTSSHSPLFPGSPLSTTDTNNYGGVEDDYSRRASNDSFQDSDQIATDNNNYTSSILVNIEAIRAAAAAASSLNTEVKEIKKNKFRQKPSANQSASALDHFLNNQEQHLEFLRRSSSGFKVAPSLFFNAECSLNNKTEVVSQQIENVEEKDKINELNHSNKIRVVEYQESENGLNIDNLKIKTQGFNFFKNVEDVNLIQMSIDKKICNSKVGNSTAVNPMRFSPSTPTSPMNFGHEINDKALNANSFVLMGNMLAKGNASKYVTNEATVLARRTVENIDYNNDVIDSINDNSIQTIFQQQSVPMHHNEHQFQQNEIVEQQQQQQLRHQQQLLAE